MLSRGVKTEKTMYAGGWQLGRGPVVYKEQPNDPKTPPINAWFVATSSSQQMSVLATAGTAARSIKGWFQDFIVAQVVDWKVRVLQRSSAEGQPPPTVTIPTSSFVAYTALGTAHGTANVINLPLTQVSSGTKVHQYLQAVPAGHTIYVTGHSMGGTLSSVAGLELIQDNPVGGRKVVVLPSAGASPSNTAFSKL